MAMRFVARSFGIGFTMGVLAPHFAAAQATAAPNPRS